MDQAAALCGACVGENLYSRSYLASILDHPDHQFWLLTTTPGELAGYIYFLRTDLPAVARLSKLPIERLSAVLPEEGADVWLLQSIGLAKPWQGQELSLELIRFALARIQALGESFNYMLDELERYIENLSAVTAEKERIGAELSVATHIQASMFPCIFPAFPGRQEFDIYATMTPAKEVGGDFYDFFLVDADHLAVVMADVSGKGCRRRCLWSSPRPSSRTTPRPARRPRTCSPRSTASCASPTRKGFSSPPGWGCWKSPPAPSPSSTPATTRLWWGTRLEDMSICAPAPALCWRGWKAPATTPAA